MRKCLLFFIPALGWLLSSCQSQPGQNKGPATYDLTKPEKYFMPGILLEISGISFREGNRDTIFTQQDEEGRVFMLKPGEKKYNEFRFARDGDFEDITWLGDHLFVLRSDGVIYSIPSGSLQSGARAGVREWTGLLPPGEYEGLFGKSDSRELYVLCKLCKDDRKTDAVSIYVMTWSDDSLSAPHTRLLVSQEDVAHKLGGRIRGGRLQPSALAQHPVTGDWYILSSVNKMLIIADREWTIREAWPLPPSRFRQPEGIAFDSNGNLFISNEGDEVSSGNILEFAYKPLSPEK